MKVIHHCDCLLHNPPHEILSGKLVPYAESPERIELIRKALVQSGQFDLCDDLDHEIDVEKCIKDVHDPKYVSYLQTAYVDWVNDGGSKVNTVINLKHRSAYPLLFHELGGCFARVIRSYLLGSKGCEFIDGYKLSNS
jgi:acetoin utilization deacetylase AcuC-like enzyme